MKLKRILRVVLRIVLVLVVLVAIAMLGLWWYLNPKWTERYSFDSNQLKLESADGAPQTNALVIRIAGQTRLAGSWGGTFRYPERGSIPYIGYHNILHWDITSGFANQDGLAVFPPLIVPCHGSRFLGQYYTHGLCIAVFYKRSFATCLIRLPVDEVLPTRNILRAIHPRDRSDVEFDVALLRGIKPLLSPFEDLDYAGAHMAYWDHRLPDGRSVHEFATEELRWIGTQLRSSSRQEEYQKLTEALAQRNSLDIQINH